MPKYVVTYHTPATAMEKMKDSTPEDMKKGMEMWMAWAMECGDGLVDMGTPLGGGPRRSPHQGARPARTASWVTRCFKQKTWRVRSPC